MNTVKVEKDIVLTGNQDLILETNDLAKYQLGKSNKSFAPNNKMNESELSIESATVPEEKKDNGLSVYRFNMIHSKMNIRPSIVNPPTQEDRNEISKHEIPTHRNTNRELAIESEQSLPNEMEVNTLRVIEPLPADNHNENSELVLENNNQDGNQPNIQIPPRPNEDTDGSLRLYVLSEVGKKYRRHLALLFIKVVLFPLLLLVYLDVYPFHFFVGIVTVWESIIAIHAAKKLKKEDIKNKFMRWKFLMFVDWLLIIQFQVCAIIKLKDSDFLLSYATLPGYANIVLYCLITEPPKGHKSNMVLIRLALWTQLLLFCMKLDGNNSLNWSLVFLGVWLYVGLFLIVTLFNFVFVLLMGCLILRRQRLFPIEIKTQAIGIFWYFALTSVSVIWLIMILGATRYLSDQTNGKDLLKYSAIAGCAHSFLLILYALLFKRQLIRFITFTTMQNLRMNRNGTQSTPLEAMAVFEPEELDKTTVFNIISQTYFTPLENSSPMISKEEMQKLKEKIWEFKNHLVKLISTPFESKPIPKEELMSPMNTPERKPKVERTSSFIGMNRMSIDPDLSPDKVPGKLCLSENDIDIAFQIEEYKKVQASKGEDLDFENLCFICAEREPNALFLNCGHGGVCYECALKEWKERDKCMTCRSKIEKIVKLHQIKNLNIAKATSAFKKTYKTDQLDQNTQRII